MMSYGRGPPDIKGMTSLKVDNLTYRTTPEDLRRSFEKYGEIGDVYIPRDRFSRESRGFAFIRYYDRRDAEDAMEAMDGRRLDGRELRVQMARYGRPETPPHRRRRRRSNSRSRSRSHTRSRSGSKSRSRSIPPEQDQARSARSDHHRSPPHAPPAPPNGMDGGPGGEGGARSKSRSHSKSRSRSRTPRSRSRSKSPRSRSRSRSME
ncbi:serine/arginine-rich splicing factor 2-like isoform X2 [Eriocheir sinensis]|uniref:serine/arginine-rich splicing factor 2-like isoform X2 n=1 Tax=Eriocheir sinensis TaxID=95602 RepID=UPI0021C9A986|nr:serine/arginine-rich splicing factor 2-like isoform X2 [Eriocheir sinensis]